MKDPEAVPWSHPQFSDGQGLRRSKRCDSERFAIGREEEKNETAEPHACRGEYRVRPLHAFGGSCEENQPAQVVAGRATKCRQEQLPLDDVPYYVTQSQRA